jgi:hypothetical protein
MLVTMLPSRAGDGIAEPMMAVARHGATADRPVATDTRQDAAADRQGAAVDH